MLNYQRVEPTPNQHFVGEKWYPSRPREAIRTISPPSAECVEVHLHPVGNDQWFQPIMMYIYIYIHMYIDLARYI